jgi:flagellar biosynthesis/type III secretory pathway M-ring protein FliF/YscJ
VATDGTESGSESFWGHLRQLDHWTFLLALALVTANVVVQSQWVSATAATLLLVALVYDAAEFYRE